MENRIWNNGFHIYLVIIFNIFCGEFCGFCDIVSWVFRGWIWQLCLNGDLFPHWLQSTWSSSFNIFCGEIWGFCDTVSWVFRGWILQLLLNADYHESLEDGLGNCVSMLIYFYIDYNFVISNIFIFDASFSIANCR